MALLPRGEPRPVPAGERDTVYKGRLKVAGDPGNGISVDLLIDDVYVDLVADGEMLGRWRMDVVEISRLAGNEFSLALDGEQMVFAAADPLGFAYNAAATVEEIGSRLRKKRGLFRRRSDGARRPPEDRGESAVPEPPPVVALDDLLPSAPVEQLLPPPPSKPADEPTTVQGSVEVEPIDAVGPVIEEVVEVPAVSYPSDDTFDLPVVTDTVEADLVPVEELVVFDDLVLGFPDEEPEEAPAVSAGPPDDDLADEGPVLADVPPDPDPTGRQDSVEDEQPLATEPDPVVQQPPAARDAGTPTQKRRLFGRNRVEEAHVHEYSESRTVGGITRRVCSHCGHVSFAGEDVYQEWT